MAYEPKINSRGIGWIGPASTFEDIAGAATVISGGTEFIAGTVGAELTALDEKAVGYADQAEKNAKGYADTLAVTITPDPTVAGAYIIE